MVTDFTSRSIHPFLSHSLSLSSVLTSDSDVKELLPEFYMSSEFNEKNDEFDDDDDHRQDGEFLTNQYSIDFGVRHDNVGVGDVRLPPWAENERDFVYQMRQALESDYVSQHLHQWIDLIFGYKQRGEAAREADNLFHYLTYGVPDNHVSKSTAEFDEQLSLETQMLEFGQVPKQVEKDNRSSVDAPHVSSSFSSNHIHESWPKKK